MTRPALELKIYPPIGECPPRSDFGYAYEDWMDNRSIERQKRWHKAFDDAELAAETYRQMLRAGGESGLVTDGAGMIAPGDAVVFGPMREECVRMETLKRFAVLDHASVKDYA